MKTSAAMSGVGVVAADERDHLLTGEPLRRRADGVRHRLVEELANVSHSLPRLPSVRNFSAGNRTPRNKVTGPRRTRTSTRYRILGQDVG